MAYRINWHIRHLDDDSLLRIFSCYRLEDKDKWYLQLSWLTLAHICRRWRYLIFDSSFHLDICLLLTNGFPSMDTLGHLPPIPLIIDYSDKDGIMERKDEDNVYLGLQQYGRLQKVALRAPSWNLRMLLEPMSKPFPRLGDLSLSSTTTETSLVLPETFQAPFLHRLSLRGICLPKGLAAMIALSTISLTHIRDPCYFSPGQLVTQLRGLFYLEELSIGFAIPMPLPSSEGELLPPPISPVTLHSLRRLTFQGAGVYLDNLVAQINTPLLERLSLTLFFELAFTLLNLTEFIHRTEVFECLVAQIIFNKHGVSIDAGHDEQWGIGKFCLQVNVNCKRLDWQIDSATQVCSALGKVLSGLEKLTLGLDVGLMPLFWEDALDSMLWLELLLPFIGVKKLHIGSSLRLELSQALESADGSLVLELLPELQELEVPLDIYHATNMFSMFTKIRKFVARPVLLLATPTLLVEPQASSPRDSGQTYRNQAMNLISICQNFVKTQEQTFRSYDKLRRLSGVVADALVSSWQSTRGETDHRFEIATHALSDYEREYREGSVPVVEMMEAARAEDLGMHTPESERKTAVKFLIQRSLLDPNPIIVKRLPGRSSSLPEVIWKFSRPIWEKKYLTLNQNPHFYKGLPTSPEAYGGGFRMEPIKTFPYKTQAQISVLVDNPGPAGWVFLDTARRRRAFGNVWAPNDAIIFKDVHGMLEGEDIVGEDIQGIPNLWCFEEPPLSLASVPALSLTVTQTQITSAAGILIHDWREPIRRMLRSKDVNILLTDKPPSNFTSIYSDASS